MKIQIAAEAYNVCRSSIWWEDFWSGGKTCAEIRDEAYAEAWQDWEACMRDRGGVDTRQLKVPTLEQFFALTAAQRSGGPSKGTAVPRECVVDRDNAYYDAESRYPFIIRTREETTAMKAEADRVFAACVANGGRVAH